MTDPRPEGESPTDTDYDLHIVTALYSMEDYITVNRNALAAMRAANRELKRHLDQRASGTDPLTEQLRKRVADLEAANARLEQDKERLDWLLEWFSFNDDWENSGVRDWDDLVDARIAIDAARAASREATP